MYTKNFYNKNLRDTSRDLRGNTTYTENRLWRIFLRFFKPRVHRQRSMGNFIVDFYIPKVKLVIEIDGSVHDDEKSKAKDIDRTTILNRSGISVIRFKNEDILQRLPFVCKYIQEKVSLLTKI